MLTWKDFKAWLDDAREFGVTYEVEDVIGLPKMKLTITNVNADDENGQPAKGILFADQDAVLGGIKPSYEFKQVEVFTALETEAKIEPSRTETLIQLTPSETEDAEESVEEFEQETGYSLETLTENSDNEQDLEELETMYTEEAEESTGEERK